MYCPKCGALNNTGNHFCVNCGVPLKKEPPKEVVSKQNLAIGDLFLNRYKIEKLLGSGGMGEVYKAYDLVIEKNVAVKILQTSLFEGEEMVDRFLNEAKVAKQLSHENIALAYVSGFEDKYYYIVMEYVEGQTLREWIKKYGETADIEDVIDIVLQICSGLKYAHQFTIHRDIKPENIIISSNKKIKIMDFGISKTMSLNSKTQDASTMGTAYYVAPEQMAGAKSVDERADIFSLGVIFYELITGKVPVGSFKIPTSTKRIVSRGIGDIIKKALA